MASASRKVLYGVVGAFFVVAVISAVVVWRDEMAARELNAKNAGAYNCGSEFRNFACEVLAFQTLTEQALVWRGEAQQFLRYVAETRQKEKRPLTSNDLGLLHDGVVDYLELRKKILAFAHKYRQAGESEVIADASSEAGRMFGWRSTLALAAALVLYDNYLIGIQPFQDDGNLRRLINNDNKKARLAIDQVTLSYRSRGNMIQLARGLQYFERFRKQQEKLKIETPEQVAYLNALILGSPTYDAMKVRAPGQLSFVTQSLDWLVSALSDRLTDFRTEVMGKISGGFGNAVGVVELRKGLLYGKPALTEEIEKSLKPLDILLEKTPFRLTDALIPGHWGHVAVWVGTPEQLIEAGVWDHPVVKPYQLQIRQGRRVIEALRAGVVSNELSHFLNVDDMAVVRPTTLTTEHRTRFLVKAFEQLGKAYDFNFDVETDKRIVCSELIYVVFDQGYDWPTERMMGRATISPDHVARAALEQPGFEIERLYHEGRRIEAALRPAMQALLDADQQAIREIAKLRAAQDLSKTSGPAEEF